MNASFYGITPYVAYQPIVMASAGLSCLPPTPQQQRQQAELLSAQAQYGAKYSLPSLNNAQSITEEDIWAPIRKQSAAHIMKHEADHIAAAGGYAGQASYQYGSHGEMIAGSVPIFIPPINLQDLENSAKAFQTIDKAALAPSHPSSQDLTVSLKARSLLGQTQVLMHQKKMHNNKNTNLLYP